MQALYLVVRNRNRRLSLEEFVENQLDRFLRRHNLEIISYEVMQDAGP